MRKLGTGVTYLAPGRAVKETARVCEVRGGDCVMHDRADPAAALAGNHGGDLFFVPTVQ